MCWGQSIHSNQRPQVLWRGLLWVLVSPGPVPCPLPQRGPQPRPALSRGRRGSPSATGWPQGRTRRLSWCCPPPGRAPRAARRSVERTGTWGGRARLSRSRHLRTHALPEPPGHAAGSLRSGGQGPREPHPRVLRRRGCELSGGRGLSGHPRPLPPSCWPLGPVPGAPPDPGPGLPPVGSSTPPSRGWTRGAAPRERESWRLPPETAQECPLPGLITPRGGNSLPLGPGPYQEGGALCKPCILGWGPNPNPALEPKPVPAGLQGSRPAAPPHETSSGRSSSQTGLGPGRGFLVPYSHTSRLWGAVAPCW